MAKTILEVSNLKTYFHTGDRVVRAVDDVSFKLNEGEVLGIVGESGSGKSVTSLSIINLINPPGVIEEGQILFKDNPKNVLDFTSHELQQIRGNEIGLIFQEPMNALNPSMRCGEQIREAIVIHVEKNKQKSQEMVLALLDRVGLKDSQRIYKSYPHQLSGGQLQRVMIAMAVSCSPSIVIADEPTTALDVTVQQKILNLFREIKEEYQASLIFISHDLGVISEIADRVLIMFKGKVVEEGKVKDVLMNPQHPYTKGLLACRPSLIDKYHRLPTSSDFMESKYVDNTWTIVEKKGAPLPSRISPEEHKSIRDKFLESEPIITVNELSVKYPKGRSFFGGSKDFLLAVDKVSFDIRAGETLGLVGESGSGKSSLGRAILNLESNATGEVWYKQENLLSLDERKMRPFRKDLQIIFQDPYSSLNPRMKIGTAISEVLKVHGYSKDREAIKSRTKELLNKVGMSADQYNRYPHQFSGGQRQRICIARTLAVNPKFIVCDESVSALDVSVQAQVLNLLKDLQEEMGLSYLFISHDLSVVKHMSDRIIVMKDGRIVEEGNPFSIYESPKTDYTKALINAIPGK